MQYLDMRNNGVLGSEYKRYMEAEQKVHVPVSESAFGSTDFVSWVFWASLYLTLIMPCRLLRAM